MATPDDATTSPSPRVVVIGGGNAALCAAISARENGADVVVLERAPRELKGGNSAFTAGAMRVVYNGVDDLKELFSDLSESEIESTDFGQYSETAFLDDLARVTDYRTDPDLSNLLVTKSFETLKWMTSHRVRFLPMYGRQAFNVNGRFVFWGGLTVEVSGGGKGLIDALTTEALQMGIKMKYGTRAVDLNYDGLNLRGVRVRTATGFSDVDADAVIIASGGFQANTEWRTRYLGPGWDLAKVRGTRYNTGDGIRMGLDAGASAAGNWSGCHAVAWDFNAPEYGDLRVGDGFQKHSYPFGIMVNKEGQRFVDEGADFRNFTYAKYGQEILRQTGQCVWQVFDQKTVHLLRDEYRIREATRFRANTLEELAAKLDGIDETAFLKTIETYNSSVRTEVPFDPNVKDGRGTVGITPRKTNWANTIDTAPFEAYAVTCGITFTFGGLRITEDACVIDDDGVELRGLYACGEAVGGIFYFNYPGGTGLTSGSVFGRIAGRNAALRSSRP